MSFIEIRSAVRNPNAQTTTNLFKTAQVSPWTHTARMANLALAFMCDRPYRHVEPTARPLFESMGHYKDTFVKNLAKLVTYALRPTTTPEKTLLEKVVGKMADMISPETAPRPPAPPRVVTEAEIYAWLAVPETDARKAWRLGREAKAKAKREARRLAFIETPKRVTQAHESKVA